MAHSPLHRIRASQGPMANKRPRACAILVGNFRHKRERLPNELASKITSSIASSSTISMMFSHSVIGHVSIFRQFYKCTYSRSSTSLVIRRDSLVYDQSLASTAPTAWSTAVWHSLASSPDVEKSSIWTTEFSSSDGGLLLLRDETCDIGSYTRWRWAWWCRN